MIWNFVAKRAIGSAAPVGRMALRVPMRPVWAQHQRFYSEKTESNKPPRPDPLDPPRTRQMHITGVRVC